MGCDITLHVEVKIGGHWHNYNMPDTPRNYALYCRMAGVRPMPDRDGEIEPIAPVRGLPNDVSEVVRHHHDDDKESVGIHDTSWLSSAEIKTLIVWMISQGWKPEEYPSISGEYFGYLFGNRMEFFTPNNPVYAYIDDFRFVFWFDN